MDRFVQRTPRPKGPKPSGLRKPLATGSSNSKVARNSDDPPAKKKPRVDQVRDGNVADEGSLSSENEEDDVVNNQEDKVEKAFTEILYQTSLEVALPAIETDNVAIREYEAMKASQSSQPQQPEDDSASARLESRQWVPGKSSIYVDAFNLALDTVLEDEAHLFNDKERRVFDEWRGLSYESQYLLVPI